MKICSSTVIAFAAHILELHNGMFTLVNNRILQGFFKIMAAASVFDLFSTDTPLA